jgi:hypothetical protein
MKLAVHTSILGFFVPGHEIQVETDVLRNVTRGIILQKQEDGTTWKPVGYYTKTITTAERAYLI